LTYLATSTGNVAVLATWVAYIGSIFNYRRCPMYGNKQATQARLERLVAIISQAHEGLSQIELARALGVSRATVCKDLVRLEGQGICLAEDSAGRLSVPDSQR
jgi:biotin operon repressor